MADKSRGRVTKKPAMTIKERRVEKRAKMSQSSEFMPRRKRAARA